MSPKSPQAPSPPKTPPPKNTTFSVSAEIQRIIALGQADEAAAEILGVGNSGDDEEVTQAWKRLVFMLHPDKLQRILGPEERELGAEALLKVHAAKDELKRRAQERSSNIPEIPKPAARPRCMEARQGARKYEVSWVLPESKDPSRPIEKYEIWGAKHFSEDGTPYDWVMLASLPPLQSHFVIVEESPTQQDVMWAADRVRRTSLPLSVCAVNGKGSSDSLTFELPWIQAFPWLRGMAVVMCRSCFTVSPQRGSWTKCRCGASIPADARLVVRCPHCHGEILWSSDGTKMNCTCCLGVVAEATKNTWRQSKVPDWGMPPPAPPRRVSGYGGAYRQQ